MNFSYFRSILLIAFTTAITLIKAQTVKPQEGCAPLVGVDFIGIPGSSGSWEFGDNADAAVNDAKHTYSVPGNYEAVYKIGTAVIKKFTVKVYGKPIPAFSADVVKGCIPFTPIFTDASTAGGNGGTITKWQWNFGDGGAGNTKVASHTYSISGIYTVTLIVTDEHQCDSVIKKNAYISVSSLPKAVILTTPTPPSSCKPPFIVNFDGSTSLSNSPTGGALTYLWEFPGSIISTVAKPPAQTYTTSGTFPVKLTVENNFGCKAQASVNVILANPLASFLVGDTVCKTVQFQNQSTGTNPIYDYGDGTTGTVNSHTYSLPGTYKVKLTVSSGACKDDTVRTIVVEDPIANFKSVPTYSCNAPAQFNLVDLSTGNPAVWDWSFTNFELPSQIRPKTTTSTLKNPTFTVINHDTNQYSIYGAEYFNASLTVTTRHGCKSTKKITLKLDTVFLPTARFMPDVTEGCAPLTVNFTDRSLSREQIVYWKYHFGDGTPAVEITSPQTVTHTYTNVGTYWPYVVIKNSLGCIDTSYAIRIRVSKKPTPDFTVTPTSVCANTAVQFKDLTPLSDSVDTWHYSTDGAMMSSCFQEPNPVWKFNSVVGPQNVTLTVGSKGCFASVTKTNIITVKGPIAQFYASSNCGTPMNYKFTAAIQDANADTWTWDFGDNTVVANSKALIIDHTYAQTGDYTAILTASGAATGCPDYKDTVLVKVRKIKADFTPAKKVFCTKEPVVFNASASIDVDSKHTSTYGYYWLFGDNSPSDNDIRRDSATTHAYTTPGIKTIRLVVKDINGCRDTLTKQVKVMSTVASFTSNTKLADKVYACLSPLQPQLQMQFNDLSKSDTLIDKWSWSFGDGGLSTLKNPAHTYNYTVPPVNEFKVTFVVTNTIGCKDSINKSIIISKPDTTFTARPKTNICVNDAITFEGTANKNTDHVWNFGDGTPVAPGRISPAHPYTKAGKYAVNLTLKDSIGCMGTNTAKNYVYVQDYPITDFISSVDGLKNKCYPLSVDFTDKSIADIFQSREWDLGTGGAVVPNATVNSIYDHPGTYKVKLKVTTTNGCFTTVEKSLIVDGSAADFSFTPDNICKGGAVTFTIKDTSNVFTYHWDFGDGFDAVAQSPITHQFKSHPKNGKAVVTLIIWSRDSTCRRAVAPKEVGIQQVIADFNRNNEITKQDTAHCINIPDVFTSTAKNADIWGWDFGDGTTAGQVPSSTHKYTAPGIYNVALFVKSNSLGCVDTLKKRMEIFALPNVVATGGKACVGNPVSLMASGGTQYVWEPAANLTPSNTVPNPTTTVLTTQNYTVTVSDNNGCSGTASVQAYIQQRPPGITKDTTVIVGQKIPLILNAGTGFIYEWTPKEFLNCTTCPLPISSTLKNKSYTVAISDTMKCGNVNSYFNIIVKEVATIDLPSIFTPNGDNANDKVYVRGWGLKRLLEFKIYNRFGQVVFETNDLEEGWDGTFQGVPQNMETYVYQVSAETYVDDKPVSKRGYIKLVR